MNYTASSLCTAGLPASPYPAPSTLDTVVSPSRRRLPPTPGGPSSQITSMMMPEPVPYYPPGAIPPASYTSLSYSSSSSGPPSLSHRTTASSTTTDNSSHLHIQYSNGPRSTENGEKTPISSNEYPSHASNASYFNEMSTGNYLSNINTTDDIYRPPGALPPSAPSAHSSTSYSNQSPLFNPYTNEKPQVANGYQLQEPHHNQSPQTASFSSQPFNPPALPPPPFPPPRQHPTPSYEHHLDSSAQYADVSPPVDAPPCMFSSI